ARIFDFGAVSILYEIAIEPGTPLEALIPTCDVLYDSAELDAHGASHRAALVAKLGRSIEKPHRWEESESYTIVFVEELSGGTVEMLTQSEPVAKLLLGEQSEKPLSLAVRQDVLKNAYSYLADDLVIID